MKLLLDKAKAGNLIDAYESVRANQDNGVGLTEAVAQEFADRALVRYGKHIAAFLRKQGIAIEDGEVITLEVLRRCINEKTGIQIEHMTPDGVAMAVDTHLSARLSGVLGVEVTSLQNVEALKQSLIDGAIEAVKSGRATKLISGALIRKLKNRKAWQVGGVVDAAERKRMKARVAQKRFRKTHVGVWRKVGEPSPTDNPRNTP